MTTRVAAVLLQTKTCPRLARLVLAILPNHAALRAFHSVRAQRCSLPAVLDLAKRLTPKKARAEVRNISTAIKLAVGSKADEAALTLSRLEQYMPCNVSQKGSWAVYHALSDVVVPSSLTDLEPLMDLEPKTLQHVLGNSPYINAAILNHYPQHDTRHMVRLLLSIIYHEREPLRGVLARIESHPGFVTNGFPEAVVTIARQDRISVVDVLDVLEQRRESCEMVIALALAGTPGTLGELQNAADAILQRDRRVVVAGSVALP